MGSPLPPDPYRALGLPKDCPTAAVKTAHRKLVLKCHPDKVVDPAAKQAASDQFHLIQSAYEILVDEDRRGRYDAQVRLAELRKEAMEKQSSGSSRPYDTRPAAASYKAPYESTTRYAPQSRGADRVSPLYEERHPTASPEDYFTRKDTRDSEYERAARRTSHDVKEKSRSSPKDPKDNVRAERRERERRAEKDTRRDRDRKYSNAHVESDSDSEDDYRRARRPREEDDRRRARDAYHEQARRDRQEAENGYIADERTRKMFTQDAGARDYIMNSRNRQKPETQRPTSPVRTGSDKDRSYARRESERPAAAGVRQTSYRAPMSGQDAELPRRFTGEGRRLSLDPEEDARRPRHFATSKSSPADIRIPSEKPRAQSLQHDFKVAPDMPGIKRAETMPIRRSENTVPTKSSNLRPTDMHDGIPTPGATPDYNGPSSSKYAYGKQYADDAEYPTPDGYRAAPNDGYRTEYREPVSTARPAFTRPMTRSPSPARDQRDTRDPREKARAGSAKYEAAPRPTLQPLRTGSTRHVYSYSRDNEPERQRPSTTRASPRDASAPLFGEVHRSEYRSPSDPSRRAQGPFSPPDDARYSTRDVRPEKSRTTSGYASSSRQAGMEKPRVNMSRSGGNQPVYARG